MRRLTILTAVAGLVVAFTLAFAAAPKVAQANPSCGDTLFADTTLDGNLPCSGTGLFIGADGIVVDLNGFVLSGDGTGNGVDNTTSGFDDVQIINGVIQGFEHGVRAVGGIGLELNHLIFTGHVSHAVDILDSNAFQIRDSSFTFQRRLSGGLRPSVLKASTVYWWITWMCTAVSSA